MKSPTITGSLSGIFIESSRNRQTISFKDIVSIQTESPYIKIKTCNNKCVVIYMSLSKIAKIFPENFLFCNQSFIVNVTYIKGLEKKNGKMIMELVSGTLLTIPRRKSKNICNIVDQEFEKRKK